LIAALMAVALPLTVLSASPASAATVYTVTAADLGSTWRPDCPVGPDRLRRVELPYLDRNRIDPGMLHDGDPAVRAFTERGWTWGGHWRSPKDYQRFER
jgi:D-alanyl-D-alanine carboxypeptidase